MPSHRSALIPLLLLLLLPAGLPAQDSAFTKEEFAARRARLVALIPDGAALVFGGEDHGENVRFRQAPDFFYLTGIEQPGSVLLVSGVTKRAVVFAPREPGGGADAGLLDSTAQARRGIEVLPMESFFASLARAVGRPGVRTLYLPLTPPDDQLHARFEAKMLDAMARDNPVFGHEAPLAALVERIRRAEPQIPVADVNPLLDSLRWIKTPYEVERLRRAGAIGAAAVAEAIRGTRPGMYEYELAAAARYVNTRLGARGDAFLPIVALRAQRPRCALRSQHPAHGIRRPGLHGLRQRLRLLRVRYHPRLAGVRPLHGGAGADVPVRARGQERDHRRDAAGCHHPADAGRGRAGV